MSPSTSLHAGSGSSRGAVKIQGIAQWWQQLQNGQIQDFNYLIGLGTPPSGLKKVLKKEFSAVFPPNQLWVLKDKNISLDEIFNPRERLREEIEEGNSSAKDINEGMGILRGMAMLCEAKRKGVTPTRGRGSAQTGLDVQGRANGTMEARQRQSQQSPARGGGVAGGAASPIAGMDLLIGCPPDPKECKKGPEGESNFNWGKPVVVGQKDKEACSREQVDIEQRGGGAVSLGEGGGGGGDGMESASGGGGGRTESGVDGGGGSGGGEMAVSGGGAAAAEDPCGSAKEDPKANSFLIGKLKGMPNRSMMAQGGFGGGGSYGPNDNQEEEGGVKISFDDNGDPWGWETHPSGPSGQPGRQHNFDPGTVIIGKKETEKGAKEKAEREAKEKAEKEAKEKAEREAKEKTEKEAKEKAEKDAKEKEPEETKGKEGTKQCDPDLNPGCTVQQGPPIMVPPGIVTPGLSAQDLMRPRDRGPMVSQPNPYGEGGGGLPTSNFNLRDAVGNPGLEGAFTGGFNCDCSGYHCQPASALPGVLDPSDRDRCLAMGGTEEECGQPESPETPPGMNNPSGPRTPGGGILGPR